MKCPTVDSWKSHYINIPWIRVKFDSDIWALFWKNERIFENVLKSKHFKPASLNVLREERAI